jgi:anti-sigma factor RsiW
VAKNEELRITGGVDLVHDNFNDLLQQYIDRDLGALEAMILEEHLSDCQTCRRELNQLKLMDWDLQHQPVVELPSELAVMRAATVKTCLATVSAGKKSAPLAKTRHFQQHVLQHTFSFISYNPVNRAVAHSVKKSVSFLGRAAGNHLRKRSPVLSRIIPGPA